MKERIKPVLLCALTAVLCAIMIVILDTVSGVPFNNAVPLALIVSLIPYAFLFRLPQSETTSLRSSVIAGSDDQSAKATFEAHGPQQGQISAWKRPATIHSIVFAPTLSNQAHQRRSAKEA